jgi:hypothetical protein
MRPSLLRTFGFLLLLGIGGAVSFGFLFDDVTPAASVDLRYSRAEIMELGSTFLQNLGYEVKQYQQDAWFGFQGNTHLFFQMHGGMKFANDVIRSDSFATHHWYLSWYDRGVPVSQAVESYQAWISPSGRVLGFSHVIKDSASRQSLTAVEARRRAEAFLTSRGIDLSAFTLATSSQTQEKNRLDHRFVWQSHGSLIDGELTLTVQGDEIGGYRLTNEPGPAFEKEFASVATTATFLGTSSFAVFFFLFFFIVILFLKKYHEGEVGTKTGLLVFIGLFSALVLYSINAYPVYGAGVLMGDLNRSNTRMIMFGLTVFIYHVFVSVLAFAAWSVGESSSRGVWPKKMTGVDSMLFWKLNTLDVAQGITRGFLWGLFLLGAYAAVMYGVLRAGVTEVFMQSISGLPEAYVPALRPFFAGITGAVVSEVIFRLFFLSYLKEKLRKTWLSIAISVVLMAATTFVVWDPPFGFPSFWISVVTLLGFGVVFSLLYIRYDLLTTLTANFVILGFSAAVPIFSSSGGTVHATLWLTLALLGSPLLLAVAGFVAGKRFEFTPQTLPPHIERITQRERMAKELEIARRVQMSLLPKANPHVEGYDIAGICIPALEVGGDYYDFVSLEGRQLGIAIGDVSGKGVPAAIYMTLTKGILQSHAEDNISPKKVLSKVNNLMYRTIDRNFFVSMFYAVLDPATKMIRFARAGQCPMIVAARSGEKGSFMTPRGMALGLEMGKVFDAVLEEQEMALASGEVLVFYTDGFTEAMDAGGREFGEERLVASLARHRARSAQAIIEGIVGDVTTFTAGHAQHDDMTMVVVRVE